MKKAYIEAQYRIKNKQFNYGYICIDGDSTTGLFTFDSVRIQIKNGIIHFYLSEYSFENFMFLDAHEFIGGNNIEELESPRTYILKSSSNETLSLELIKRITDPKKISDIEVTFKNFLST